MVVVLIGFPDLEPDDDDNAGPDGVTANECIIRAAYCGITASSTSGGELCQGSYDTPLSGTCGGSHPNRVKQIQHCLNQGMIATIPEAGTSVSAGTQSTFVAEPFTETHKSACITDCGGGATCQTQCQTGFDQANANYDAETKVGILSMNNTPMATYVCEQDYAYYDTAGNQYRMGGYYGPNSQFDAVCCN